MKNVVNRAFMAKKKQYINPQIEVLCLSGTAVMLGASGDTPPKATKLKTVPRSPFEPLCSNLRPFQGNSIARSLKSETFPRLGFFYYPTFVHFQRFYPGPSSSYSVSARTFMCAFFIYFRPFWTNIG